MSPSNLKKHFSSFLPSLAKCPNSLTWLPGHLGLSLSYFSALPSTLHAQCSSHTQLPSVLQTQYISLPRGLHTHYFHCAYTLQNTPHFFTRKILTYPPGSSLDVPYGSLPGSTEASVHTDPELSYDSINQVPLQQLSLNSLHPPLNYKLHQSKSTLLFINTQ